MSSRDFDLFGDAPTGRSGPTKGRRARKNVKEDDEETPAAEGTVSKLELASQKSDVQKPDRPSRRKQTWAITDTSSSNATDERLVNNEPESEEDENIPVIPELEEMQDNTLLEGVAAPPTIFQELLSFRELDTDLMKQSAFSTLDGDIDLKLLTKAVINEKDLVEPDEIWDMNQLCTEMQSIVTSSNGGIDGNEGDKKEVLI